MTPPTRSGTSQCTFCGRLNLLEKTGVVWCTRTIAACIQEAPFLSSVTERYVVLRALLPKSGRELAGVQQCSTPEAVVTAKRHSIVLREAGGQGCSKREEDAITLRVLKHLNVVVWASGSNVPDTFLSELRGSGPYRRAGS